MANVEKILTDDTSIILAYDHGMEHGPSDFNVRNVDPEHIFNLALEGDYDAVAVHHGLAHKYYHGSYKDVPLVVKLNGKTKLPDIDPISRQFCSVKRAVQLGADAVGYTIYDGSPAETEMFQEFGKIVEEAHDYGIPVICWMYPRGPDIQDDTSTELTAYSARIALELGADFVKLKYNGDPEGFKWVVKNAGECKVLLSGGSVIDDRHILQTVKDVMDAGATGLAVGRNAWKHPKPFSMTKALQDVIREGKSVDEALQHLQG